MITNDTIAAISSVPAPCARIIIRLSGQHSQRLAAEISDREVFPHASATPVKLHFSDLCFPALTYSFIAPRSYTGEDCIEFHMPGSPVLAKMLLDELYRRGARPAEPGEFTARAFFNGKMGLTEAEGVAAAIAAGNEAELTAARQLLAGELARRLSPITDSLAQTLALIEVGIDFTEEDVTFLAADEVTARIARAESALNDLLTQSSRFEQLTHEPRIVFAGRPNAGKSSLINALTGQSRAVVSEIAGTTRDVLSAALDLPRGRVLLADVAGIDQDSTNGIDHAMQRQAAAAIASADYLVLICDCTEHRPPPSLGRLVDLIVLTKGDLLDEPAEPGCAAAVFDFHRFTPSPGIPGDGRGWGDSERQASSVIQEVTPTLALPRSTGRGDQTDVDRQGCAVPSRLCSEPILVSSKTGAGLVELETALGALAFGDRRTGAAIALNRRHLSAIQTARESLSQAAARVVDNAPELVAMDLRDALDSLGGIVGQITRDDVLGRIFSAFCIGK